MSNFPVRALVCLALGLSLTACSDSAEIQAARTLQQQMTGGGDSPVCKLFTAREIGAALGAPVADGYTSGPLGTGCSWPIKGQDRNVMIQVVPREYWEDGTAQPGGTALEGIGEKAFVGPWLDDWRAGALTMNGAVYVMSRSKEASVSLLRDAALRARDALPREAPEQDEGPSQ